MAEPFIGEIKIVAFNFAPKGWALCDGQILGISQNTALFSLLGTSYGGDGMVNFALPDFRGRAPVHVEAILGLLGTKGGEEAHALTVSELPAHGHVAASANQATSNNPAGQALAFKPRRGVSAYAAPGAPVVLSGAGIVGGGQPHDNMQPYLTLNFVIALQGIFPSRD